jgi:hemolysin III
MIVCMVRVNYTSVIEEVFNAITHGVGAILSIIGLIMLLILANKSGSMIKNIGFSVFGIAITFSYLSSTLYHSLCFTKAKKIFKILDFSSIFLLIAGTYTPFILIGLKGQHGMFLLYLVWLIAVAGIVLKSLYIHKFEKLSAVLYLLMGWLIVFEAKPLLDALSLQVVLLLGIGGLFYTFGVVFYLAKKLPFNHAVWHIFVLCGGIFHFFALLYL